MSEHEIREDERRHLIERGEELTALFISGPERDNVYGIFDELKQMPYVQEEISTD